VQESGALANRGCARLVDKLKVVCGVERCPLRLAEYHHRPIESDQEILGSPIVTVHFHSSYDSTYGSSYLLKPLGASNAVTCAEVRRRHGHGSLPESTKVREYTSW